MEPKLKKITTQYHTFEDNQVLTKDQLNEFISYFEDQDRLTRIILSGVGIVCGFNLKFNASGRVASITISQGAGVTTDGDLIKLKTNIEGSPLKSIELSEINYTHFKTFEDSYAGYSYFKKTSGPDSGNQIDLWEILPENVENSTPLAGLSNLTDKVVLLYLESYAKEGDLCTSIDCDNQGVEQVARLRVLLVSKADATVIANADSIFSKHDVFGATNSLPEVAVRRVVLNKDNSGNYNDLKRTYYQALNNVDDNLITNLSSGILNVVKSFQTLLSIGISDSTLNTILAKLKNIVSFSAYSIPFNVQYRYDCLKDVVDTYNEIKSILLELETECCPDINAFPKHLLLGSLADVASDVIQHRHSFYKSPILNSGTNKIEQCKSLINRLFIIINQFKIVDGDTKITPSNKLSELSLRAIPFYYNVQSALLQSWDYRKTERFKADTNLSYHTSNLSSALHIQNPLDFNIDSSDFYRIEGHQGKDYKTVLEEIDTLKIKHGLAFDVKALSVNINSTILNTDDYQCEFEDLNVLLRAWTDEQECVLAGISGFFSGFSTAVPGANIAEPELSPKLVAKAEDATVTKKSISSLKAVTDKRISSLTAVTNKLISSKDTREIQSIGSLSVLQPAVYVKSNVVPDNLTLNEDALGANMKIAIEETPGGSVNDIIAKTQNLIAAKVNTEEWKSQPEVKAVVIDQSIELMAYAHVLSQRMPASVADVSLERVTTYKLTMDELCALVKKMKTSYQNTELTAGLKALIGIFINQLSTVCCSAKKLETLLEEINKRKDEILLRLQLSKFAEKHPGLEHKAGVEPGGTFVLVFLNKADTTAEKETITEELTNTKNLKTIASAKTSEFKLSELISGTVTKRTNIFSAFEETNTSKNIFDLLGRVTKEVDLPNNTVVADFALPYMCCSDCAPINFIVQKSPVSLRLEKDQFCLGKDTSPLIFEVSPADGVIKADPEVPGVTIDGTSLSFDAATFPDEMLGNTIHFTVNEQFTDAQITVYRAVSFDFNVPDSPTEITEITFIPTGNLDGASFLWSFGDDNLSIERNPTHKYELPVNKENKVTVSLTVTAANGICESTVEHDIEFLVEETKIRLEKDNYCENDKESYSFEISPAGADASIEGSGVQRVNTGEFEFIPSIAEVGSIEFKLNGEPSGVIVTVQKAPVSKFTATQEGRKLTITNNSENANSFIWNVNDEEIQMDNMEPLEFTLTPNSPTTWTIKLTASGADVCPPSVFEDRVQTSVEVIQIDIENKDYCERDGKSYPFIITPDGAQATIEGTGVEKDDNDNFVFSPTKAGVGTFLFTLNGAATALSVTVHQLPVASFTANQVGNQLILTNNSTGADSYVWFVNDVQTEVGDTTAYTENLTPNSPTLWVLQLRAISKNCGTNTTKVTRFTTEFGEVPINNCLELTSTAIKNDLQELEKLENQESNFITPVWNATSNLYGGTTNFKNGVLDDLNNYLSGNNNNKLTDDFIGRLETTSKVIEQIDAGSGSIEVNRLTRLLALQMQLFYNILGCQGKEILGEATEESPIQRILDLIIQILRMLQELGISMPDSFKTFIQAYSTKTKDIDLLVAHFKIMVRQNLI